MGTALERCDTVERLVLALLLVERLTAAEAADALGLSLATLERTYRALLAELRHISQGGRPRAAARTRSRRIPAFERLRRAS